MRQLPLPLAHRPEFTAAGFIEAPSNAAALAWLARSTDWPNGRLAVWGEAGCGKTHLLHIWARRVGARFVLLPDDEPSAGPIAIDDADAVASDEQRLLHLLNAAVEARHSVLLAARTPPSRWPVVLPDLASRLRATAAVEIAKADDTLLADLLKRLLVARQLAVPAALQSWLLLRLPRTPTAIREAVARLDRASLAAGGAVTRPIAVAVLEEITETEHAPCQR